MSSCLLLHELLLLHAPMPNGGRFPGMKPGMLGRGKLPYWEGGKPDIVCCCSWSAAVLLSHPSLSHTRKGNVINEVVELQN
jgi:hypothetical protein